MAGVPPEWRKFLLFRLARCRRGAEFLVCSSAGGLSVFYGCRRMPVVARKTKPQLKKPPVQRGPRKRQAIPPPASPFPPVVVNLKANRNAHDQR
jgi:hypothetical protein